MCNERPLGLIKCVFSNSIIWTWNTYAYQTIFCALGTLYKSFLMCTSNLCSPNLATVTFIISDYCFLKVMKTCNHIPFASFFSVYYCLLFIQLSNDTEHWSVKKFALKLYSIFIHLQSFIGHLCLSANDILKLCCNGGILYWKSLPVLQCHFSVYIHFSVDCFGVSSLLVVT